MFPRTVDTCQKANASNHQFDERVDDKYGDMMLGRAFIWFDTTVVLVTALVDKWSCPISLPDDNASGEPALDGDDATTDTVQNAFLECQCTIPTSQRQGEIKELTSTTRI